MDAVVFRGSELLVVCWSLSVDLWESEGAFVNQVKPWDIENVK